MMKDKTPRLDFHDFISGVVPGTIMVIGLFPFFPSDISINSIGAIIPLLIIGFAFGRAIHEFANTVDAILGNKSHRDRFYQELLNPTVVTESSINEVKNILSSEVNGFNFDEISCDDSNDEARRIRNTCYGYIRTYIHISGKGRARTFQGLLSFYQNMWLVSALLALMYTLYGIGKGLNIEQNMIGYTSWIGTIDIQPGVIVLISIIIALSAYETFRKAKRDTKNHYVQYLISDILVLKNNDIVSEPDSNQQNQRRVA